MKELVQVQQGAGGGGEAGKSEDRIKKGFDELQDMETNSKNKIFILFVTIINNKGGKVYIFTHFLNKEMML